MHSPAPTATHDDAARRSMTCVADVVRHVARCAAMLTLLVVLPAAAQQSQSTLKAQRLLDIADSASKPAADTTRMPQHSTGGSTVGDIEYDLQQRPSQPSQLNLSTTVETHVENKTSNAISGGVAAPAGREPAGPPAHSGGVSAAIEFRAVVAQSLGYELPVFGDQLFRDDGGLGADPLTVPADYRIGPGDQLLIHAWGQISIDFQGPVGRSGTVFLPGIGDVMVAGLRLNEARDLINGIVSTQYRDFQLTVSLAELRDIKIYLSGFVAAPGVHTVPSTATALSGLLTSGGPDAAADLRRIELRRDGHTVATLDSYTFLIDGDKSGDPQLLPGDVLYLPPARGFAAIAGSVRRPAIYHLGEATTLRQLLTYAGGETVTFDRLEARIERFEDGRRSVQRIEGDARSSTLVLRDGDLVLLVPASPRFDGSITVTGHVAVPLRQPWRAGLRVSDVLPDANALMPHAAWSAQNARNPLSGVIAPKDGGALPPRRSEINWDHAAIQRVDAGRMSTNIIDFDLGAALAAPHSAADPLLQAGDTIVVYAQDDFAQPGRKRMRMVRVEGEVAVPGVYSMRVGDTVRDAVARAGGPTGEAYLYGTLLRRESVRNQEALRLRQAVDQVEEDYYRFLATRSRDVLAEQDALVSGTESSATRTLISRLRAAQPVGRVVFALEDEIASTEELPALALEDGDVLLIPGRNETVTVVGAVFQQGTLLWQHGNDASDYLDLAGGLRPHADRSEIVVMHADGTVRPLRRGFGGKRLHPGDSIIVPEDVGQTTLSRKLRDWSTMLYQFAISAAALKVIQN
jgi:polysaccharide biosynthesis/export protein